VADRALGGIRVAVTRPDDAGTRLVSGLEEHGADVAVVPLIGIGEGDARGLDDAFGREHDWVVLTSANGVRAAGDRLRRAGNARFAAVGPATADALRALGIEPAFVPDRFAGDAIADGLGDLRGRTVLLPRADIADPVLVEELRARGAAVETVVAYTTTALEPDERGVAALREADVVLLASGSAARALASLGLPLGRALIACIGPKTENVAREVGLEVGLVADEATAEGMIRALVSHFGGSG
jgi:uroporphyrinogen-III synthase